MSRSFVKRGALMLCILAGLAVLLIRREISARSARPSALAQAGHESAAVLQTHSSGRAVYVGPHNFSSAYEYCHVDADGRPLMIHQRRLVFFLPESPPEVNDRTFIETGTCR